MTAFGRNQTTMNLRGLHTLQTLFSTILKIFLIFACLHLSVAADPNLDIILISDVNWEQLNPARGDKSPKAGTLWGDRKGMAPTGFLVKFVDGFSSPPHIHNVTYRGLVIDGQIHNDDPSAEKMWMPSGSFWTQPAGEVHITAVKGDNNLAYIEIDRGPYLVRPTEESFDNGERPVNVDESNIVWIEQIEASLAYLWGKPQGSHIYGVLIKLPAGLSTKISNHGAIFHAVVIKGLLQYRVSETKFKNLLPGSYFNAKKDSVHNVLINTAAESIIYVRTNGKLDITH